MCLVTHKLAPYKWHKDIIVYKLLEKNGSGWRTPWQGVPVSPPAVMCPKGDLYTEYRHLAPIKYTTLYSGVIHGFLGDVCITGDHYVLFKAIIPANTEFWVSPSFMSFASKKLEILDEQCGDKVSHSDSFIEFCQSIGKPWEGKYLPLKTCKLHIGKGEDIFESDINSEILENLETIVASAIAHTRHTVMCIGNLSLRTMRLGKVIPSHPVNDNKYRMGICVY